ncbi:hypothetical protein [Parasulfitobacter algicola]|uniref:Uncharacterized protein n=1 Tax=Parasulfitobacter algicola TaxID=2614809 RepID=A0ABX2IUS3_9RHOB|nr:hypothetical protein [Sulfitobacter algicola]NSX54805.1 hypothetical protein [Sulfitobacter algicola]
MTKDPSKDGYAAAKGRAKAEFNMRSWETKSVEEILKDQSDQDIRDQDNAQPTPPKPSWAQKPAPNLAPSGASGIKRSWNETPEISQTSENQQNTVEFELDIQPLDMPPGISDAGIYPAKDGDVHYRYSLETGEKEEYPLEGTNVVQLEIYHKGEILAQYDSGWLKKVELPQVNEAIRWIEETNDPARAEEIYQKKDKDPDIDI